MNSWTSLEVKQRNTNNSHISVSVSVHGLYCILTSNRWEVDADQQSEKGCDVIDYVRPVFVLGRVASPNRCQLLVFYQHLQRTVL